MEAQHHHREAAATGGTNAPHRASSCECLELPGQGAQQAGRCQPCRGGRLAHGAGFGALRLASSCPKGRCAWGASSLTLHPNDNTECQSLPPAPAVITECQACAAWSPPHNARKATPREQSVGLWLRPTDIGQYPALHAWLRPRPGPWGPRPQGCHRRCWRPWDVP